MVLIPYANSTLDVFLGKGIKTVKTTKKSTIDEKNKIPQCGKCKCMGHKTKDCMEGEKCPTVLEVSNGMLRSNAGPKAQI